MSGVDAAIAKLEQVILFPVISFMLAVAALVFFWGAYQFVLNAESDGGRETGRKNMMYGIIGMLVMISAFAILKIAIGTFNIALPE